MQTTIIHRPLAIVETDHASQSASDYWAVLSEQYAQARTMFEQTAAFTGKTTVRRDGPHADAFVGIVNNINNKLAAIHPGLTAEHLKPTHYQDPKTVRFERGTVSNPMDFFDARDCYREQLATLGVQLGRRALANSCTLIDGELDTPYFMYQGDGGLTLQTKTACFSACFRMIYASLTGTALNERPVVEGVTKQYGSHIVDDDVYLNAFHTPAFNKASDGKDIRTITLNGADLSTIKNISGTFKQKLPGAAVFTIVSLASETQEDVWHTNVLTGTNSDGVQVHDPSANESVRGENRIIDYENFYKRWARTFNRAHLVISDAGAVQTGHLSAS